jgi:hypothetical protein
MRVWVGAQPGQQALHQPAQLADDGLTLSSVRSVLRGRAALTVPAGTRASGAGWRPALPAPQQVSNRAAAGGSARTLTQNHSYQGLPSSALVCK